MSRRKTPEDYRALAEERGFRWLGPEVPNTSIKTWWECERGHKWEAAYVSIRHAGSGCPACAGNVPKGPGGYHALAEENGFRWLGPKVPNIRAKTWWECEKGHQWEGRYNDIQQGHGCPFCAGLARKTPADYHRLGEERDLHWLGPEVPNVATKTWWECAEGHRWEARYASIQRGDGCPVCAVATVADKRRFKSTDYHALAEERGFRWLGPEVPNVTTKTRWECSEGHQWEAIYASIKQGRGCPYCAGVAPKTPEDYRVLAKEHGFRWLGPEVPTVTTKTNWECGEGHQWEARFNDIQQGYGCPFCAGKVRKTPEDYHALARERGFRWLGPEVSNIHTVTNWECELGHRWEAPYNRIQQGYGCPACVDIVHGAPVSQVQRDLCEMLGGELNAPFGPYKIDVALNVRGVRIAVEYDSWYWHAGREEYDAQRDAELLAAGWRVLRVRSKQLLPTREQLDKAIARLLAGETRVEVVLEDWGEGPVAGAE